MSALEMARPVLETLRPALEMARPVLETLEPALDLFWNILIVLATLGGRFCIHLCAYGWPS
jgi:hypothetical protein